MKITVQRLAMCLLCLVGFGSWVLAVSTSAGAEVFDGPLTAESGSPMSLAAPFAAAPMLSAAQLSADAGSRSEFRGLGSAAALALAEHAFNIQRPAWVAPGSEGGARVDEYLGQYSAVERLPGGGHQVVDSTIPLRVNDGSGLAPMSLTLRDDGEAFVPVNPVVPIAISTRIGGGIALPGGLSVTPVGAAGSAAPHVVGDSVVFANEAQDTDLLDEPRPSGAEVSWQLRSQESPVDESLAFNAVSGLTLRWSKLSPGGVEVLAGGEPVLLVPAASAQDARGASVPVSYSITGNVLTTHVDLSGNVDFPVMVDPVLIPQRAGYYGTEGGAHVWSGWIAEKNYSGFGAEPHENLLKMGTNPGAPLFSAGWFTVTTPGPAGKEGSAGITRVDLTGVTHEAVGQSRLVAYINETDGPRPNYSWNGYEGESGSQPLYEEGNLSGRPIAFCASGAGGRDGDEEQPLCNEESYQGRSFVFKDEITASSQQHYNYVQLEGARITYRDPKPPNKVTLNHESYAGAWLKTPPAGWKIEAEDEGLGVSSLELKSPANNPAFLTETIEREPGVPCDTQIGFTGCPNTITSKALNLSALSATGSYSISPVATDAALDAAQPSGSYVSLYIDHTPPVIGALGGSLGQAAEGVIGSGNYTLTFDPVDGSIASPQSGVRQVEVKVDGRLMGTRTTTCTEPKGVPAEACFALSGSVTVSGQTLGVGAHTVTVVAKDWAGNEAVKSFGVTVNEAAYAPVGPGAVNLETGDFKLDPTDVALPGGGATLSVSRVYDSRNPNQSTGGPLGPQWSLSLPASGALEEWQSLTPLEEGDVEAINAHGGQVVFSPKEGGGWVSPAGYQLETLSEPSTSPIEYEITDSSGDYTRFTQSGTGAPFTPHTVVQASAAGELNKVTYTFTRTSEGVTEPTEIIGPEPTPGACTAKLVQGCRALTFEYASSTTASGEGPTEWGSYKGRLNKVFFTAWEPGKGEMSAPVAVAQYAFDKQGRLRAEWDPRLSTPLKTTYGWDEESHITAVSAPGQQPWLLHYGGIEGDSSTGRLLSVLRPKPETALWKGEAVKNSSIPALAGSADVGVKLSTTNGVWAGAPGAYGYQWEDCNSLGKECSAILGATNQTYVIKTSDLGHKLVALVTATSAGGSVMAETAASGVVVEGKGSEGEEPALAQRTTIEYHVSLSSPYALGSNEVEAWGQKDDPADATAVFPPDEPQTWPASHYTRASIFYLDSANRTVNSASPSGAITTTEYTRENNVKRTLSADNRVAALKEGSKSAEVAKLLDTENWYSPDETELIETIGPQHLVKLSSGSQVTSRELTSYSYDEGAPEGHVYHLVTSTSEGSWIAGQNVEDKRTVKTSYSGQENLGWKLHAPTSSSTSNGGHSLVSTTKYEPSTGNVIETQSPAAAGNESIAPVYLSKFGSTGSEPGQLKEPKATALTATGNVLVLDGGNSRVEEYSATGGYLGKFGELGSGNGQLKIPAAMAVEGKGNVLVADTGNDRGEEFNAKGEYQLQFGKEGTAGGQFKEPKGIAVGKAGVIFVVDTGNSRVEKFNEKGEFLETFGFGVAFGNNGMEVCKTNCRAGISGSGNGQLSEPRGIAISSTGNVLVADAGNNRVEVYTEAGAWVRTIGSSGSGNGQLSSPKGVTTDAAGNVLVTDTGNGRLEKFTPTGGFLWAAGSKGTGTGQFEEPWGPSVTATGSIYVADLKNNRVQQWAPTMTGNPAAHDTQTIYYTAAANSTYPTCGNHPEWATLPCQAQPAAQPGSAGLPNLPVTTYTSYNIWNEPLTIVDTVGSTTRTTTIGYDAAGRTLTTAISSSVDTPVPTVTDEYSVTTGALVKQSTTTEGHTKSISGVENSLGQLTSYTDADGNIASYEYETERDFRLLKVNDGKGTQTYSYDTTTGLPSSLKDSAAGTFTATRDVEGNITSEGYPNGMSAKYTLNPVGEPTNLEYEKTTHCTGSCIWFSDSVIPSIHGQWLSQTSSLSKQNYAYNEPGWLTEVQDTPTGQGCTTRLYAYDEDGNRTSLTTRAPGSEGKCASEGGSTQSTFLDSGDRLDEPGVSYETFGNVTGLPAADAGGSALTSSFYVNNKTASLTQNGQTISYNLDPAGRTREAIYTGTVKQTTINHYAGSGDSPVWTATGSNWTRNITGIGGGLAAIQTNGGTTLQLANLHGDIIATASLSETETKLLSTSDTTEFGVSRAAHPAKYSWLGAAQRPTEELESGAISMGARTYIPQLGRFEQPDPQPGGSINAYAYTFDDPVNQSDLSGEWTSSTSYDPEAAETGASPAALPESYLAPGAVTAPPVDRQIEEAFLAQPPRNAASADQPVVIWERGGGCSGTTACASSFLGFKVNFGSLTEWWDKVKKGWELVKKVLYEPLVQTLDEQKTLCKAIGYGGSAALYYIPETKFAKELGFALGIGTTYTC